MSKVCKRCESVFSTYTKIDGKFRNLKTRSYCLSCVPFGSRPGRKTENNLSNEDRSEAVCRICQETKTIDQFYVRRNKKHEGRARSECKTCLVKYFTERARKNKIEAIKLLGDRCADCQVTYIPEVYDFHHLDPNQKDIEWRKIRFCSKVKREAELKKCVLLCSNCHRIRHVLLFGLEVSSKTDNLELE